MRPRTRWGLLVAAALGLAWAGVVPVKVTPIVNDGRVLASFSAPSAFTDDAEHVMRTGLLLTFTFTVELRQPSPLWFDRTLAETTVASSVKYDSLTSAYQVSKLRDGRVIASERMAREPDVLAWMTSFDQVPLVCGEPLERNADYYVQVRLRTSPRPTVSLWPWGHDDGSGRAVFTFIR
jgi:hypothetical protein